MSIKISDKDKSRIVRLIDKNSTLKYSFNSNFLQEVLQKLEDKNELDEIFANKILEELYEREKVSREIVTPNEEFEKRFEKVFENYDNIPKPNQYGVFEKDLSNEEILKGIESCFELRELVNEMYNARDSRKVAKDAINSIEFLKKNNITVANSIKEEFEEIKLNLQELLNLKNTDIEALQEQLNSYNHNAMKIWNDYLSNPTKENDEKNYLVHNFTGKAVKGEFRDKYMSTSLITKNARGVYGNSGFGMIIKPKNIVIANSEDTYTINDSKNEEDITIIKQPVKLPQQIEIEMMEKCKNVNGEILNSDNSSIYSEVVVSDFEVVGIYLITTGEKELNNHYLEAIALAKEKGVPFKEIDISKEREEKGLSPLSKGMKKRLCRSVLYNYVYNEKYGVQPENYGMYVSDFIEKHCEEFAEKFLKIKKKDGYTAEDIEKEFRKMILDDAIKTKDGINILNKENISHYNSFFLGNVTEEEFKYIVINRYNFNTCETLGEFKEKYREFNQVVLQGNYFDEESKYLEEIFSR